MIRLSDNILKSGTSLMTPVTEELVEDRMSPFILHPGMKYRRVKRRDCSGGEIQRLLAEGGITECHDAIIKALGKYGYLNSFLTRTYLFHISGGGFDYDYSHMRRILKDLIKKGLIMSYELFYVADGTEHGSPFFYTLSGGGIKYLKHQGITELHPIISKPFSIENVLNLLALNQFHVTFMQQYGKNVIVRCEDYYDTVFKALGVPAVYTFKLRNEIDFQIALLSVRNSGKWVKKYLNQLRSLADNMESFQNLIILTICESEYQTMECAKKQNCERSLQDMDVFYITDTSIISGKNIFDRIIEVRPENDYSIRRTFRLNI